MMPDNAFCVCKMQEGKGGKANNINSKIDQKLAAPLTPPPPQQHTTLFQISQEALRCYYDYLSWPYTACVCGLL